ncbi:hypothetical protein ACNKF0_13875 [Nocardioides sp. T5]|uniref:hypothetical protein n=1 Tax=Nocardioides sp. T5 TaxID=3400182 RepID=UPI003A882C6F
MSDVTHAADPQGEAGEGPVTASPRRLLLRVLAILAGFVAAGAAGGVLWERLWDAPTGLAFEGRWYLEPAGPDFAFEAIALFVVIAFPIGLLLAVLAGRWRGHETVTVVTVLVAAGVAAAVMYAVGSALGPPDPQALAAGRPDYTPLPGDLGLTAPDQGRVPWHSTALVALPAGAMAGLVGSYLLGNRGFARRSRG